MEDETHAERLKRVYRQIEEQEKRERAAWHPAESLERTAWNVLGCWQMLVSEVNFIYFDSAGPTGDPLDRVELPVKIRNAAQIQGIRWPHDDWSAAAGQTKNVRHKLAHLLYIDSISGTDPDRTMTIVRMGEPGEAPRTPEGHPRGLSWRHVPDPVTEPDGVTWSQMRWHLDTITEAELSSALEAMRWMRDCCRVMHRLGSIAKEIQPRRALRLPAHEQDELPWWFPDWGDPATTRLTWGNVFR
ncbi:hypothetical protein IFM12275_69210 (plasmid) [Nocardia sputorum]|uniref:hypothetical protein n=1 Tax=Nocardia sputorum TaxID=2984338 RepID=UPI0024912913|nr:hypothetical protein [Nocardia sputorum]BDT96945.1 hypothetical protein IFM12275_69210 [Nocardia sputorum]